MEISGHLAASPQILRSLVRALREAGLITSAMAANLNTMPYENPNLASTLLWLELHSILGNIEDHGQRDAFCSFMVHVVTISRYYAQARQKLEDLVGAKWELEKADL